MARQLVIELVGNSKKFTKTLNDAEDKTKSFSTKMDDFGKKMTTRVTLPILGAGVAAFKMASDLNESLSATEARFGANAGKIKEWAANLDSSFGLTEKDALDMATQLRAVTQNSELTNDQMLTLAERAADVGSQFNMSAKEVGERFRSAMTGSTEVLEIFGVNIKQGSQGMEDYAKSIGKSVTELTEAEKQAAFYDIIMKQTSTTQGDAAKTADTAAGKMRTLKTDMANTAAEIGQTLMPAGEKLLGWLQSTMGWLDKIPGGSDTAVAALLAFAAAGPVIRGVTAAVNLMTIAINLSRAAAVSHPFAVLAVAMTAVAVAADKIWQSFGFLESGVTSLSTTWENLTRQVEDFIDMVKKIPSNIPGGSLLSGAGGFAGKLPIIGGLFRASGGPVNAGDPYVVGEDGPELFVPGRSGSIIPNHAMASGGGTVVNLYVSGSVITERDLGRVVADALRNNRLVGVA